MAKLPTLQHLNWVGILTIRWKAPRIPPLAPPNRRTTTGSPVPRKRQPIPLLPQSLPPRPPPLSPLPPLRRQTPHRTPPKTTSRIGTAPCSPPRSRPRRRRRRTCCITMSPARAIVIDKSTLLGRKPSMDVPQGAKAVRIVDPTRTTSRNHAAISIDTDGALWIEDYGSLNGTYIITNWPRDTSHQGHTAQAQRACHGAYRRPVLPVHRKKA